MVEETDSTLSRWKDLFWDKKFAPWHLEFPHPKLVANKDVFLGSENFRILVPFCGKTVDMKWLYELGHEVVGVEGTAVAIKEFFEDSCLEYALKDDGVTYQTADKKLTIIHGNFFTIAEPYIHSFDCVWERAALTALPPENRKFFADAVKRLAKENFRYIIVTTEYDQSKVAGPPYSITMEDIASLYEDWAKITPIGGNALPSYTHNFVTDKFTQAKISATEKAYLLENL